MIAKLRHVAVASQNQFLAGKFYELLFGLRASGSGRGVNAAVLSDGYVGFNINGRRPGGIARLDHFGFEVSDVDELFARVKALYPTVGFLKRLSMRPFAGITKDDVAALHMAGGGTALKNGAPIASPAPEATEASLWAIAAGLAVSLAVGVFFGLWPAIRASRLEPVEALRYE